MKKTASGILFFLVFNFCGKSDYEIYSQCFSVTFSIVHNAEYKIYENPEIEYGNFSIKDFTLNPNPEERENIDSIRKSYESFINAFGEYSYIYSSNLITDLYIKESLFEQDLEAFQNLYNIPEKDFLFYTDAMNDISEPYKTFRQDFYWRLAAFVAYNGLLEDLGNEEIDNIVLYNFCKTWDELDSYGNSF
jgi:hypothetical protein